MRVNIQSEREWWDGKPDRLQKFHLDVVTDGCDRMLEIYGERTLEQQRASAKLAGLLFESWLLEKLGITSDVARPAAVMLEWLETMAACGLMLSAQDCELLGQHLRKVE